MKKVNSRRLAKRIKQFWGSLAITGLMIIGACNIDTNVTDKLTGAVQEQVCEPKLEVHYIDVGQGDATLIKAGEHAMLIDAGDNTKGTVVQLYLKKQGVEKLDYLILTHTDADHIGGADVIITKFDIEQIFMGDFPKENATYRELLEAMEYRNKIFTIPEVGSEFSLGKASFTILAPVRQYDDPNNSGIALILQNGKNSFLFAGDCEDEAEEDMLMNGMDLTCDVYKVSHHGSQRSSSSDFLKAMSPESAVISCEKGNAYGHPHAEVVERLEAAEIQIFRTDQQGNIVAYSDGNELTWKYEQDEL